MCSHEEIVIDCVLDSVKGYGITSEYILTFEQFYHEKRTDQYHAIVRATFNGKIQLIDLVQPEEQREGKNWNIQTITDVPRV
jgi:hypothetical protein